MIDQKKAALLRKKINIILAQPQGGRAIYRDSSGKEIGIEFSFKPRILPFDSNVEVVDEQVNLLRMLHDAQDGEGKAFIVSEVAARYTGLQGRLLLFVAKFGGISSALALFRDKFLVDVAANAITPIAHLLCCDSGWISDTDLDQICIALREIAEQAQKNFALPPMPPAPPPTEAYRIAVRRADARARFEERVKYICGQIGTIRYMRLKKELQEGANFEINQDRDRLAESLQHYGFSPKLTEFLQFAEREFDKADGEFSYKSCIDQIRSFFAGLLAETADKVAASRGTSLKTENVDRTRPAEVRKYLFQSGFFSEQFKALEEGFYKFMSVEGTHTLGSTKEVARLARNLAIEIGLLITKRVAEWK